VDTAEQTFNFQPAQYFQQAYHNKAAEETFLEDDMIDDCSGQKILNDEFRPAGRCLSFGPVFVLIGAEQTSLAHSPCSSVDSQRSFLEDHGRKLEEAVEKMKMSPGKYFASRSCKLGYIEGAGTPSERVLVSFLRGSY
jgi:hypothetical protein